LQTFRTLRVFKIVFRDSSLYAKHLSLFCLLWLSSASADRIGYIITKFCSTVVPKLWYANHQRYAKAFKVVRETLLFFYTKTIHFVFTYRRLLINSCIFVYFPY